MQPVKFKGANTRFTAAPGDTGVGDLYAFRGQKAIETPKGPAHMKVDISAWQPTALERADIAAGRPVFLEICNPPEHPHPVSLYTYNPFEPTPILITRDDGRRDEAEQALQEVHRAIPRHIADQVWLTLGAVSKIGAEDANALLDAGTELLKFLAGQLNDVYQKGIDDTLEMATQMMAQPPEQTDLSEKP